MNAIKPMTQKYIYDLESSALFDEKGFFLKKVFCPKAKHWNQLIADDPSERSRGCRDCGHRVVNLDDATEVSWSGLNTPCVYIPADSKNVTFLQDLKAFPPVAQPQLSKPGVVIIKTARTIENINRAANMGYWPDVRLVEYKDQETATDFVARMLHNKVIDGPMQSKLTIGQDPQTGRIESAGDFRLRFDKRPMKEVIPFTYYYPYYQRVPVAAYLIPPDLPNASEVMVEDPIEDLIGRTWNQGDVWRSKNVKGFVRDKVVQIDYRALKRSEIIG